MTVFDTRVADDVVEDGVERDGCAVACADTSVSLWDVEGEEKLTGC